MIRVSRTVTAALAVLTLTMGWPELARASPQPAHPQRSTDSISLPASLASAARGA